MTLYYQAWATYECVNMKAAILSMMKKLVQYSKLAMKKPVYICAPILDPRRKLNAVTAYTLEELGFDQGELVAYFTDQEKKFKTPQDPDIEIVEPEPMIDDDRPHHFIKRHKFIQLEDEVKEYLLAPLVDERTDILVFWRSNRSNWPVLSRMAMCMLAIPASAAPSERVFSSGSRVMSDYRSSMTNQNFEAQICLKSWDAVFSS